MKRTFAVLLPLLVLSTEAAAHHGVATLGAAGLEGRGAPIETPSSATLPRAGVLVYSKLDYASFEKSTQARDDEADYNAFWMFGLGYGCTSYFSAYIFVPYNSKVVQDNSFNTSGFADLCLTGALGFKYDQGLRLVPPNESLDDLEDWHFTVYSGCTLPTGDANVRDQEEKSDPGMSLGFGKPAFTGGLTATKTLGDRLTLVGETSYVYFQEYGYADGNRGQFGDEFRVNGALSYRLFTKTDAKLRIDANLEPNYMHLGRDQTNGVSEVATGGDIFYLVPGMRSYWRTVSLGIGVKLPALTDLNEESDQQGSEGKENYRLVVTFSSLF